MSLTRRVGPADGAAETGARGKTCEGGACTSCGGAVAWVRLESGGWRLFDALIEHDCPAGGYRPGRRPLRGDGKLSEGGRCTSCGAPVAWAKGKRWRLVDAEHEHDCPAGGYPLHRPRVHDRALKPVHRKLIAAAMASRDGRGG